MGKTKQSEPDSKWWTGIPHQPQPHGENFIKIPLVSRAQSSGLQDVPGESACFMKRNELHTAQAKNRATIGKGSSYENIPRPSAFENRCKPGDIEIIIKYHNGNPIISKCHQNI